MCSFLLLISRSIQLIIYFFLLVVITLIFFFLVSQPAVNIINKFIIVAYMIVTISASGCDEILVCGLDLVNNYMYMYTMTIVSVKSVL